MLAQVFTTAWLTATVRTKRHLNKDKLYPLAVVDRGFGYVIRVDLWLQ
jgi:hypothetical protein